MKKIFYKNFSFLNFSRANYRASPRATSLFYGLQVSTLFFFYKTDRRVISQFLSIVENLNQIRQALWDLNLDSEEVRRVLRSLDRTVSKTASLKLTTFSRPSSGAEAKRILTSRPQTPASRGGSRPVSAASAIYRKKCRKKSS